ncbi:FAD:protein FMN transferase [uncultured Ferrimonas sp.]|uniref:FAD:protein FMN transferase n=1 Tax=uncultured Ferrimonas sp. TaxID=432640 RepID=UPI002604FE6E|nr:FAD:protein FMN transferase [uncultured Ferrimonas sp.]
MLSSEAQAQWHQQQFQVMGTQARVELWLVDQQQAQHLIRSVQDEMQRIEQRMSPYIASSELSQINSSAAQTPLRLSDELFALLSQSAQISALTNGAFDISYASVGYQYDYRQGQRPNSKQISAALPAINYRGIKLNAQASTVSLSHPNLKIDLGGIAKGYAVKQSLALLQQAGVEHALIAAGGDTALLGDRRGRPWMVGIKHPRAAAQTAVHLPLTSEAISTSGDYERFFIEDGVRYHHIINPKTGDSAREVVSVSVIGKDPTQVDALSTAVFVLGLTEGMALIDTLAGYEAIIIDNRQKLHLSAGLGAP